MSAHTRDIGSSSSSALVEGRHDYTSGNLAVVATKKVGNRMSQALEFVGSPSERLPVA
jgi:hypothetical protein